MDAPPPSEREAPRVLPAPKPDLQEIVKVFLAEHQQALKDILYESCEKAVKNIAEHAVSSYMKAGGNIASSSLPLTPAMSNGNHHSAPKPPIESKTRYPQVQILGVANTYANDLSPKSPRLGKAVAINDREDVPLKYASNNTFDGHLTPDREVSKMELAKVEIKEKTKVKLKAHTRDKLLGVNPRESHFRGSFRKSVAGGIKGGAMGGRKKDEVLPGQGIFADGEAMKEKLRAAMTEPTYDVTEFYYQTGWCQAIAKSGIMENLTLGVIGLNALWISIDVDHNKATIITDSDPLFQAVDNLFCLFFTFEILVRFGAFEVKKKCLRDAWFVFDSGMCLLMTFETWALPLFVAVFATNSGGDSIGDASLLKGLRLVRLVRMARVLRLLRALPELMVVIKGLFVATRAVSCTIILMLIIIYVFAITFRQITDGTELGDKYFPNVPSTMRYLLVQGTMPDLYSAVYAIWDEGVMFALCFLVFILITSITVMNMLVGVLVGVVNTVASVEKEQLMVSFVKEHLLTLLREMNANDNSDGLISKHEFCKLIQTPDAIRSFTAMGVDVVGLVDLADFLFHDESVGIPFPNFMEMIMQLRGSNQATVKDIVDLRRFMTMEMRILFRMLERLHPEINQANSHGHFTRDPISLSDFMESETPQKLFPGINVQKTKSMGAIADHFHVDDTRTSIQQGIEYPALDDSQSQEEQDDSVSFPQDGELVGGMAELAGGTPDSEGGKKKKVKKIKNGPGQSKQSPEVQEQTLVMKD